MASRTIAKPSLRQMLHQVGVGVSSFLPEIDRNNGDFESAIKHTEVAKIDAAQ